MMGPSAAGSPVPLQGICEFQVYLANFGVTRATPEEAIDRCLELHLEQNLRTVVWAVGRSTVDYWSDLPGVTVSFADSDACHGADWSAFKEILRRECPLRRALAWCRREGVPLWGRLSMNRHYGSPDYAGVTSRFARAHPAHRERSKEGREDASRLCYALPEVQRERLDILLEVQRIGVDALVLDFCRQMPMVRYHDAVVGPFREATGIDPRSLDGHDPGDYHPWFRHRADVITGFLARLRAEVRRQEQQLGRPCPIVARVPDSAPWLMVAAGLDVETWCVRDLVDATMLSPFPWCVDDISRYPECHARVAHRYGKQCYGGIGTFGLFVNPVGAPSAPTGKPFDPRGLFHPRPVLDLAARQLAAGVDAMSIYQSDTTVRLPYLAGILPHVGDPDFVAAERSRCLQTWGRPAPPAEFGTGLDWHAREKTGHALRATWPGAEPL